MAAAVKGNDEASLKSALVLGWFHAEPKQLKFVERLYKKNGFTDVVVNESPVSTCSRPGGWYNTILNTQASIIGQGTEEQPLGDSHPLARRFDVVHVMSGGFLNLYLLLSAGVKIDFNTLVLDSTPILPKPSSFTRFARAYMDSVGLNWITRILPARLHLAIVCLRWMINSAVVKLNYELSRRFDSFRRTRKLTAAAQTLGTQAVFAMTNRYGTIVEHTLQTVFGREGLRAIFVYNPSDPFLQLQDVDETIQKVADDFGCQVKQVEVNHDHVQTLFRQPKAIFGAINQIQSA